MRDAMQVRDLFNTEERVTITVRPGTALLAQEVEASFVRHDDDPARNAWTGGEKVRRFENRLKEDSAHMEDLRTFGGNPAAARKAAIRCGAWVAFILAFTSEEAS